MLGSWSKALVMAVAIFMAPPASSQSVSVQPISPASKVRAAEKVVLEDGNFVSLIGEVSSDSVSGVIEKISSSRERHLYLFISSPGGSIVAGSRLISAMKGSGKHFTCITDFAASMAFIIMQSDPCEVRLVTTSSIAMQHTAAYGLEGKDQNNKTMMAFIQSMLFAIDTQQAGRLGMTLEAFRAKVHDDFWWWGLNSITDRAADGEALISCDAKTVKSHETIEAEGMFGMKFSVEVNKCPLINKVYKVDRSKSILVLSPFQLDETSKNIDKYLRLRNPRENLLKGGEHSDYDLTP